MAANTPQAYTVGGILRGYGRANGGSISLMVMAELASPALLALSGLLIVVASTGIPIMLLTVQIVSVRAMALLRAAAGYAEDILTHDTAFRLLADLRVDVWARLIPLVPGPSDTGLLLARVSRDVDDIRDALLAGLIPAIAVPVSAIMVVLTAWLVDPLAGIMITLGMVLAVMCTTGAALVQPNVDAMDRTALHTQVVDTLNGSDELRAYGAWDTAMALIHETSLQAANRERRLALRRGLATTTASLVGAGTTTALGILLYAHIEAGQANHLILAPMMLMSLGAFEMIGALGPAVQRLRLAKKAITNLNDALAQEPAGQPDHPLSGEYTTIGVHQLTLDHTHITNLSFTLSRGEIVAIVGPSGVGKTSVLRALCGLQAFKSGQFTLNDEPVPHLRDVIAVASQDAHLMPTTIHTNVAIGAGPTPGDHLSLRVAQAMDTAQLGEWLKALPEGAQTHVGIGQISVSGGQQRRIALARALVSDRPFVALDEPTSGLDQQTARAFLDDALQALANRGVLIITHDTDVIERADRVITLSPQSVANP